MKILVIILIGLGVYFSIKQLSSANSTTAGICAFLAAIFISIASNYIYDAMTKPENSTGVTPQPDDTTNSAITIVPPGQEEETPPPIVPPPPKKVSVLKTDTFYSDGLVYYDDEIIDNEGNRYIGYATMESGNMVVDFDGEAVYKNKNYKRFTGRVITAKRFRNCDDCGWIRIYGDDELIFDSGKISRGVSPKDFDLDISLYSEIKIEFKDGLYTTHETNYDYAVARCFLVDSYFHY